MADDSIRIIKAITNRIYKLTAEEREEIVKRYIAGDATKNLAKEYRVCTMNIYHLLKARNIHRRKKIPVVLNAETKSDIIQRFITGESLIKISDSLKIHRRAVTAAVTESGVPTNRHFWRHISLDENAFSMITPESAYWIGFLMADGSVVKNCITIALAIKDIGHLEKFKKFMNSGHKIGIYLRGHSTNIQFRSDKIVSDLAKYGVIPRKTYCAKAPQELEYNKDFWRGMIDGDGSVTISRKGFPILTFCGTQEIVQQFVNFVKSIYPTNSHPKCAKNATYAAYYSCNIAKHVIQYLYKDATVFLDRKYQTACDIMSNLHRFP